MGNATQGKVMKNIDQIQRKLINAIDLDIKKLEKSKKEKNNLLSQTIYLGTVGLIFIIPVIIGGYVGIWLDSKITGFSFSWTISLIFLGIIIGAINVYLFFKE
jgi:ATP synthase protein I